MKQIKSRTFLGALLLCAWWIPAQAQTLYRLTRILGDPPTRTALSATDLNDQGQVVGSAFVQGVPHAFTWRDGMATNLEPLIDPASTYTDALGINNHADIIGNYLDSQTSMFTGFLLQRGEVMTRIDGLPEAVGTNLADINRNRQIVGASSTADGEMHAFVWEAGTVTELRPFRRDAHANPLRINDRGAVIGVSGDTRGVIWRNGRPRDLGLPNCRPIDINNHNQVVGTWRDETGDHIFLWHRGEVTELPLLDSDAFFGEPRNINNLGEIVGTTFYSGGREVATSWEQGVAVDLNERIAADDPLQPFVTVETAVVINDRSQILVSGHDSRTPNQFNLYLLTPVL